MHHQLKKKKKPIQDEKNERIVRVVFTKQHLCTVFHISRQPEEDYERVAAATTTLSRANTWCELDLTALAQQWVSMPSRNYGVLLRGAGNAGVGYSLASSDTFNQGQRPIFEIAHTVP